jgi:hypothetical protein
MNLLNMGEDNPNTHQDNSYSYYDRIRPVPIRMFGGCWFYEWRSNGQNSIQE